jgi:succinyl-CoA synthetase beta subunit
MKKKKCIAFDTKSHHVVVYSFLNDTSSPKEAREIAAKMLGHTLITKQTGPQGKLVSKVCSCTAKRVQQTSHSYSYQKVLVCRRHYIRKETYLALLLDRQFQGPVVVASAFGGMDIEGVAAERPTSIYKQPIDLNKGN